MTMRDLIDIDLHLILQKKFVSFLRIRLLIAFWLQGMQRSFKFLNYTSGTLVQDARKHSSQSIISTASIANTLVGCNSSSP